MTFDIAFVGHYTKDTIVSPLGTRTVDGGAINYGANVAARMGLRVAVVTRLARGDWHVVEALEALGVTAFAKATPRSTCLRLTYPTDNLDQRTLELTSSAGPFGVEEVAPLEARVYAIGASVRGEVSTDVVRALAAKRGILAVDVQGFLRVVRNGALVSDGWPGKEAVLRHVTVLKTDAVEAELITGASDLRAAATALAGYGPKEVLLTHRGGVLVHHDGAFHEAPWTPEAVRGRSGRGDTCTASYLSRRLAAPPEDAVVWAAAVTSLKLEAEGPFRRTLQDIEALYARLRRDRRPPTAATVERRIRSA
jgi:sugar/nucleoside kinase (ribokinase family)